MHAQQPHPNQELFAYSPHEQAIYDARQEELKTETAARNNLLKNVHDETFEEFTNRTVAFYRNSNLTDEYLRLQLKPFVVEANANNNHVKFPHFQSIKAVLEERKRQREKEEAAREASMASGASLSAKMMMIKKEEDKMKQEVKQEEEGSSSE
jgi:hypothetical protein